MPNFNSTAIRSADYDQRTRTLRLWFVESGGPYDYYGVPGEVYDGLLRAASKGTYFNERIRDRYSVSK